MNHMLDDGPNIARPALRELLPSRCRERGARVASQALRVAARSQAVVAGIQSMQCARATLAAWCPGAGSLLLFPDSWLYDFERAHSILNARV